MNQSSKIYIAGHTGLVGSALHRALKSQGFENLCTRTHKELDLTDQAATQLFFEAEKPEYVFLAAARVGGILANDTYPAEFIYENLQIQNNIIHQSHKTGAKKLIFFGSSCMYPKICPQPMSVDTILTGPPEPTNEAYALAKLAGYQMCRAYRKQFNMDCITVIPANLYGIGDNFHPDHGHVIPALLRRFHEAKINGVEQVSIWGSGKAQREFLYIDVLADALLFLVDNYSSNEPINIGSGQAVSIKELAETVKEITGFKGELHFDATKPDGMPIKQLNNSALEGLGWKKSTSLSIGLERTYQWFLENIA